ncbi:MAG: ABC transporter substrate-binding protein [Burkholderiales bacterium]|mgnify:FL=1|nr:ABC transporter substrate-binding protein [Burkholderiales bacterium]
MRTSSIAGAILAVALAVPGAASAQKTIAIASFGEHPTLDQARDGFKAELSRLGYQEGRDVVYTFGHGNFNPALIPQILAQQEARNPALMLTITTPVTQAARTVVKNTQMPIVFAAVVDPVRAQLVPAWEKGSDRMVGASNFQDLGGVMRFAKMLLPNAKSVGVPFNPGEANDVAQVEHMKGVAAGLGLTLRSVPVDSLGDIGPRVQSLRGVDFIYLLNSNLLMPAHPAVASAAAQINTPLISANPDPVLNHSALGSFTVSYPRIGAAAARLADQILKGKKPSELANYRPAFEDHEPKISAKQMSRYKIQLPAELANCNCVLN